MEHEILALMRRKADYKRYRHIIRTDALTRESRITLQEIDRYYKTHPEVEKLDLNEFVTYVTQVGRPNMPPAEVEVFKAQLRKVSEVSRVGIEKSRTVRGFITLDYAERLTEVAESIMEGGADGLLTSVEAVLMDYRRAIRTADADDKYISGVTDEDPADDETTRVGYDWRLPLLQRAAGQIALGDNVVIAGVPNAGKSSLVAFEAVHFARQLPEGSPLLWFQNEEGGVKTRRRWRHAALGVSNRDYMENSKELSRKFYDYVGGAGKMIMYDNTRMTVADVERMIERFKPGLIVFDQLSKVRLTEGTRGGSDIQQFHDLLCLARDWCKTVAPVISTNWASPPLRDKNGQIVNPYVPMEHIYGSKTALQGEVDLLVTIGRDDDSNSVRYLNLAKNKMPGQCELDPEPKEPITFHGPTCQYY